MMEEPRREDTKRKVAKKIYISDLLSGTYIKRPGFEPSGVLTKYGEVSRVNLMGTIVSMEDNSFLLDDGSGSIQIRFFEGGDLSRFALGDLVLILGKPREWESTKYVVPEVIRKVTDRRWYEIHQLEIKLQKKTETLKLPVEQPAEEQDMENGPYQKILNVIAILDKGDGVDVQEIINNIRIDNCESIVNALIEEGEIFEISPGRVKLLE